jgi:hypothetical protein
MTCPAYTTAFAGASPGMDFAGFGFGPDPKPREARSHERATGYTVSSSARSDLAEPRDDGFARQLAIIDVISGEVAPDELQHTEAESSVRLIVGDIDAPGELVADSPDAGTGPVPEDVRQRALAVEVVPHPR